MVLLPAVGVVRTPDNARLGPSGGCMIDYQFCQCQLGQPCGIFPPSIFHVMKPFKTGEPRQMKNRRAEGQDLWNAETQPFSFHAVPNGVMEITLLDYAVSR